MKTRLPVLALRLAALALSLAAATAASAEVRLPKLLSDHAVLQRDRPIHIWGWASPGAQLTARFHSQTVAAVADPLGKWSLYLAPESAGGPYTLSINGDGPEKTLTDLLIGDVWFASGQSNMEMPLKGFPGSAVIKDSAKEIAAANKPKIRLLLVEHKTSVFPLNDVTTSWTECTPETAQDFSAVAYFFGREISAKENVPVGLIDSTWGGTPADSWISLNALGTRPDLLPAIASRARFAEEQTDLDAIIAAEKRADEAAKAAGQPLPKHPWHPFGESYEPAALYNAMVAPFTPMTIKGFLWYQGETNSAPERAPFYASLFGGLIEDWRSHFRQGSLPFLYVQISSFTSPGENWGLVRDQQRRVLDITNTAMAVTLDVGTPDNVHPPDKQTVGARLALAARDMVYGEKVQYEGPLFREATTEQNPDGSTSMRVWFDHANGLTFHDNPVGGFELAGPDHIFKPADASIDGNTVIVSSQTLPHPQYVRYGWMGVVTSNLYNAAGLPASTFTSESNPVH